MKNAIKKKISPILAIALVSSLATSILAIQSSTSDDTLFHLGHNSSIPPDDSHVATAASLPLPVDFHYKIKEKAGDAAEGTRYAEIDEEFINTEIHCEFCTHITVKPGPRGQTGFAYVSDTELDLSAAKSVTFFVMGGDGGEKVKFQVGGKSSAAASEGIGRNNNNDVNASSSSGLFKGKQFALSTEEVTLKDDWTPLSVDLSKVPKEQLRGVKYPFAIEMSQMRGTQEFFIKHVIYETEEATLNPIPASAETGTLNATALNATALDSNATILDSNATALNDTSVSSATENANDRGDDDIIANRTSDEILTGPEEETELTDDDDNTTDDNDTLTETADETQTLTDDVIPPQSNRTEVDGDVDETDNAEENAAEINSPPVAKANEDITGHPGDEAILDGLESFDDDDTDRLEYEWTQSDGPDLEITDEDTATPTIVIPSDIDEDSEAVIDLVVSDGKDASEKDSVTLFIDHIEALDDLDEEAEQIQTKELKPNSDEESQWELSECDDLVDCLSDGSDTTGSVTGGNGEQDTEKTDLLSFEDLAADLPNEGEEVQIKYIVIEVDASKSEETGYIRLHVDSTADSNNDEEPYESNAISIVSGSMEEYRLILETEPMTEEEWTVDSVDSIIAGYSYAGGQSEIQISEMTIRAFYTVIAADNDEGMEEEEDTTTASEEKETGGSSDTEAGEQQEEDSTAVEEEDEESAERNDANVNGNVTG